MKKFISFVLSVVILFSFVGCSTENNSESVDTTKQVITTVPETTTTVAMSESEALEKVKYRLGFEADLLISDKLWDEYGLIADTYDYKYDPFPTVTYNESTGAWSVEIMGQCAVKEWDTRRYIGDYAFLIYATINKDGKFNAFVKTIAPM